MPRRALLPLLPLLALAALPGATLAACNPTGTEECCTKHVSVECDSVTWPTAEGASAEPGCDEVSFTLDGIVNGRFFATKTTEWTQNDPETDCPDPQTEPVEGAVVPEVTWEIFHNGLKIGEGGGPSALATNVSGGTVRCEFTMTSATEWCGEDMKTYEASTNLPTASLVLPEIVGRNDLVEPCEDPTDHVSSVEELAADEEDLYTLSWSVSPEADEVTIFSETTDKLRVLVADGSRLATTFHHPPMPEETEIWLEGIHRSDETNDCTVTMAYRIGELLCEISATTTVVSVELDKFCYNRMDPHPEVRITNVVNFVPGGTATVWCAVSPDVVESDPDGFSQTFAVSSEPGTHVFRTREVENRFRNKGWDVLRYTVYVGENGERRLAAGVSTPSHAAVDTPPPECLATVLIGDAFASTPEEALGHLDSTPEIKVPHAEGAKPDYTVPEIKLFKKGASPWHTNEMHLADLGATAVREVLLDETQDTAVGLELTVPEVVAVNDRYDAGDPGKNAAIDLVSSDPDFSPELSVEGIPGCIVEGTVTWTVSRGANLVFIKDGEMLVGSSFTFPYPGAPTPRLEGRTASEEKNDVVVTFELLCAAEGNPAAFRGQTLKTVGRTTVVDTRWTHHRPDGAGKSGERYDLLECDLDLRPSVRIDSFGAEPGGPFVVEGTVTSMIDLPTDVRVNGTPVAATNLLVGGRTVEEALADGTWGLEPPYEVSFRHEMPSFSGETLEVAAFGSVSAHPGFHRFRGLGSGATNEVRSPVLASPTMTGFYGDFLYKFEADHAGSGLGFLDCDEDLRCGAQSTNLPLYRLERTLLFLPPDADGPGGTRTEGFQIEDTPSGAPARGAYTALGLDDGSSATSISSIFPCDLDVKGGDGIVVPDCDEWWLGAFTEPGKTATLVVGDALETAGIPTNGVATLSKTSDVGGVFPDFQTLTWRYGEPPPSAEALVLTAAAPGVATFELRLSGEELASWDRVKITSLLVDVDVDSDNDNGFDAPSRSDDEDAVEDNAPGDGGTSGGDAGVPGKILPVDSGDVDGDGIPDFADGYSLFPGNADMVSCEGARFAPVVFELPEPFDPATATIWVSYDASDPRLVTTNAVGGYEPASGGRLRIWARNGGVARSAAPLLEGGDYLAPGAYAPATLGITPGSRSATFYMEAVRKSESAGDIRIDFTARPEPYPSTAPSIVDTVLATAVDPPRLDADSDNTWSDPETPSEPDKTEEERRQAHEGGVAVGLADDDYDNDGTLDLDDATLSRSRAATGADFAARLAKMSKIEYELSASPVPLSYTLEYDDSYIRLWKAKGTTGVYEIVPDGASLDPTNDPTGTFFAEGLSAPLAPTKPFVTIHQNLADAPAPTSGDDFASCELRVAVVPIPMPSDFSPDFTPRQAEAPPFHLALVDYTLPRWDDAENGGARRFDLCLLVGQPGAKPWASTFYRASVPFRGAPHGLKPMWGLTNRTDVADLYTGVALPPMHGVRERIGWDGRCDAEGDGAIDLDGDGIEIWAERGGDVSATTTYPWALGSRVNRRFLTRLVVRREGRLNGRSGPARPDPVRLSVDTLPLPLDAAGAPLVGRPERRGRFRDQIDSYTRGVSLVEPLAAVVDGAGPLPELALVHSGADATHSVFGFGVTHTFDWRVADVRVGGSPRLYLATPGGALSGPADPDTGELFFEGRKGFLVRRSDGGYDFTNRVRTVYAFNRAGQLESVTDSHDNELAVTLDKYPNSSGDDFFVRKPTAVASSCDVGVSFSYDDEDATHVKSATFGTEFFSFRYAGGTQSAKPPYNVERSPSVLLSVVTLPGAEYSYTWLDGVQSNRASRVVSGGLSAHSVTDKTTGGGTAKWVYDYGTDEDPFTTVSEARIGELHLDGGWMQTTIGNSTATCENGLVVSHSYDARGRLVGEIEQYGNSTISRTWTLDENGNETSFSSGPLQWTATYDANGCPASRTFAGYNAETFEYDADTGRLSTSTDMAGVVRTYSDPDDGGLFQTLTESGGGLSRTWTLTRNSNGTVSSMTLPGGVAVSIGTDTAGRTTSVTGGGAVQFRRTFNTLGYLLSETDADGNRTQFAYDLRHRISSVVYPDNDVEQFTYDALDRPVTHVLPKGAAAAPVTETYAYANGGKPTGVTATGPGVARTTQFDAVDDEGWPGTATVSEGGDSFTEAYSYDPEGNVLSRTVGGETVFASTINAAGLPESESNVHNGVYGFTYDSRGELLHLSRPAGYGSVSWAYGGNGLLASLADDLVDLVSTTAFGYDGLGRPVSETVGGKTVRREYDLRDNVVKVVRPDGQEVSITVDPAKSDAATAATLPGEVAYSFGRSAGGTLESISQGARTTGFQSDSFGQVTRVSMPQGAVISSESFDTSIYGTHGLQVGEFGMTLGVDGAQRPVTISQTGVPDATASYGAAGVSSATDPAGVSTAWTYGGNAEPTSVARGGTTTSVSALADGSVQSATVQGQTPAHAVSQTFDAMGNPVEVTLASGARAAYQWTGDGLLRSVSIDGLGTIAFQRDEMRAVTSVSAFGRSMSVTRDDLSRPVAFDLPGGKRVAISFDAASRITAIDVPGTADLSFSYNAAGDLVSSSVGGTPLSYETSPDGYLLSVRNADGVSRQLSYTSEGHLTGETTGPFAATYQTDPRGRPLVVNYGTGPHSIVWGGDDRISSVQSGVAAYQVSYDAANRFVTGVSATVGGHAFSAAYGNDKLGRLCSRAYGNVAISRDINDAGGLAATSFSAPGATASVAPAWLHGVKLVGLSRTGAPAGFATASFGYDAHNDLTSIRHGGVAEFDIDRDAEGRVTGVSFGGSALRDRTIRVQRNAAGWITRETGPFGVNEYEYRADGVRTATIRNGRRIAQAVSPAGAPAGRDGAVRLSRAPDEGAVYLVGPGHYATLTNALDAVYADFGAQDFTNAVTIRFLVDSVEGEPVLDAARWPLRPTSEHPLFLKGAFGGTDLPAGFSLSGVPFVRMERFRAGEIGTNAPAAAVSVRDAGNFVWASGLVANAPFSVSNAPNALLALSTFDFRVDASVSVLSCTNAALSGVLVLNRAGEEGVSSDGQISVSSDSDFWPLARSDGLGRSVDPGVTATLRPVSSASPLYGAAAPVPGVRTDLDGVLRHVVHPCVGAYEHLVETSVRDAGGRETGRRIAGVEDEREYDYYGRLVSFVDGETGAVSAYAYDFAGRRVRKQVGDAVTTMFYDWGGSDVVVETHDEDGDGSLAGRGDYVRHYWNEPGIDRRIGFRDEYGDGSTALYWYVTGPNGTVYAVLDGAGNVVNRYEYDSFGVIDWRHSFEGVPNRYTFQGRELDAERGDYYYRARIYDPDRGTFLGPDMNLAAGPFGEPNGMMSYVFCGNDPWTETDPSGLGRPWNTVPNEVSFDSNTGGMDALYGKFDPNWGYGHSYDYSGDLSDLVRVTLSPSRPLQGIGEHFINLPHRFNQYKECYDSTYAAWNALLNPLMWVALDLCEVGYGIGLHPENYVNDLSVEDRFISGLYAVGDAVDAALTIVPVAKGLSVASRAGVNAIKRGRILLEVDSVLTRGSMMSESIVASQPIAPIIRTAERPKFYLRTWSPITERPPLPESVIMSFESGTISERLTYHGEHFWRYSGGNAQSTGLFWTPNRPAGPLQAMFDSAILPEWGNTFSDLNEIVVPDFVHVFEGIAAPQGCFPGGTPQTVIPYVQETWIVK